MYIYIYIICIWIGFAQDIYHYYETIMQDFWCSHVFSICRWCSTMNLFESFISTSTWCVRISVQQCRPKMDQLSSINSNTWDWWSVPICQNFTSSHVFFSVPHFLGVQKTTLMTDLVPQQDTESLDCDTVWSPYKWLEIHGYLGLFHPYKWSCNLLTIGRRYLAVPCTVPNLCQKASFCLGAGNVPFIAQYIARTVSWGKCYEKKQEAGRPPECSFLLIYEIEISQVITNVHYHIKTWNLTIYFNALFPEVNLFHLNQLAFII